MCKRLILFLIVGWASLVNAQPSPFVIDSRQDLDIAITNYAERIKSGPEVSTIYGNQITPGTLPRDFRINDQIYDDSAVVSGHIINIMRMVFDLPAQPTIIDNIQLAINQLLQMLTDLGIRYNITPNLASIRTELAEIRDELRNTPINSRVNTILMVPYNRLDVIKTQILDLLRTKLIIT